jgi:hypothetical protein
LGCIYGLRDQKKQIRIKKTKSRDQKKTNKDQKKQIRIKKTNKDDRSENRQETAEREDQKKQMGIHMNKNERE